MELVSFTDALLRVTSYQRDALGRVVLEVRPDADSSDGLDPPLARLTWDKNSNLRFVEDSLGNVTEQRFNERDELVELVLADPDGGGGQASPIWRFTLDARGLVTGEEDPLGRLTTLERDTLGRVVRRLLPDPDLGGPAERPTEEFHWDAASRLVEFVGADPDGAAGSAVAPRTGFEFDVLDNLVTVLASDPDGAGPQGRPTTRYVWTGASELAQTTDPLLRDTTWERDQLGRPTRVVNELNQETLFGYSIRSEVTTETNHLGEVISHSYDAYSRPVTTTDARLGVTRRAFDLVGNLSELEDAEGNLTRWLYDRLDRPVEEVNELGLSREWVWSHAADTLLRETDRNGNVREFDYDNLFRTSAEHWVAAGASPSVTVTTTTQGAPDVNERQRITLPAPAGGTWTITFAGQTTAALASGATAAQVQAALESLSNIGAGNVAVGGAGSSGNPFSVTFQGALATTDVSQLTADGSNLSGALVGTVSVQTGGSNGDEVQEVHFVDNYLDKYTIAYLWSDTWVPEGVTALEFQEILEDLSTIGPGNVTVSGAWPDFTVTFVGALANQNVESMEGGNAQITTRIEGGTLIDEVQTVTLPAERTGGTFTVAFEGQVTSALASGATAAAVDSALEALSTIGAGNVAVTGADGGPYTVTFQSALGSQDVELLVLNAAGLTGGTIATATDQQGQAGINEVQQVSVQNATDGSFKLRFSDEWTDAILFDATAAAVEAALEALSMIDDMSVTGAAGGPYTVTFQGATSKSDVDQMSGDSSGLHQPLNSIDFAYDAADQLLSAQDDWSRYAWQYDGLGRVTSVDNAGTPGAPHVVLASAWDGLSRRASLSATIDGVADLKNSYVYDTLSRMTHVEQRGQTGGNLVADKGVDFAYNPLGQFTSIVRYTDLVQGPAVDVATSTFTWDAMGRLEALDHTHGGSVITGYAWQFDGLNRVTQYSSTRDGTSLYSYDTTSQLVSADHSFQADEAFTWDLTGNRTDTGYQTGANNRLLSDGTFNYTYTGEGGLATRTRISTDPADDHLVEYGWDHRRRLVSAVYKNNSGAVTKRVEIDYDMFDRRIAKRVDSNGDGSFDRFERWVYDGDDVLLDFLDIDGQGPAPLELATRYLHGPAVDQVLAQEDAATNAVLWQLADNRGTARDVVDSDGLLVTHLVYESFGALTSGDASVTRYQFTGREWDADLELFYYRRRWYSPVMRRFISEDPIGFEGGDVNLVRYVGNEPTNATDPTGLEEEDSSFTWYNPFTWFAPWFEQAIPDKEDYAELERQESELLAIINECNGTDYTRIDEVPTETLVGMGVPREVAEDITSPRTIYEDELDLQDTTLKASEISLHIADTANTAAGVVALGPVGAGREGLEETVEQGGRRLASGATKTRGGAGPVRTGQVGERAVGITGPKTKISINGRTRIPDELTKTTLKEVKNWDCKVLSYNSQLRDYVDYAKKTGRVFELHVRSTTTLTGPLQDAIKRGDIVLKIIPGT